MPNHNDSAFNAFSTETRLMLLEMKEELRKDVREAANGVLVEMRERLERNADERALFNTTLQDRLNHIEKITTETRADGRETKEFARKTNGRVNEHERILLGTEGSGEDGLMSKVNKNSKFIAWMMSAGGAWLGFIMLLWMLWGPEIQSRGILNRPASDFVEFVDKRIQQWLPQSDKPAQPAPNLAPNNKNGSANPN